MRLAGTRGSLTRGAAGSVGSVAVDRDAASLTWVGHATVLLELGGVRLLTDPVLRERLGHLRRHGPMPAAAVTKALDAILISHLHLDHLDLPSLRRLGGALPLFVPRGAGGYLRRMGFPRAHELAPGDRLALEGAADGAGVEIMAVPALHDGRRRPLGGAKAEAIGFELRWDGRRVYFAGDTDLFPGLADLAGGLDLALLPVWGWGPTLGEGHMDPQRAAQAVALLRPRLAIPIHWGTFYPRGLARLRPAPLAEPPQLFAAQVAELAPDVAVRVLVPGESLDLSA
jgi:L-ascorbate metabolism protein UlaG (beta-lactamase superfamily)